MKFIACEQVIPECKWSAHGRTEEEVISEMAEHARRQHGIKELSTQLRNKLRTMVRDDHSEELQAA